ncbi:hypothetical protein B0T18DRAFT_175737 [Schizothecium vesticola]|uniref:Ubiquitin-like domain-containing protein n=1 Tax=Schizothecium vesticola TaxID=314040 RepID=A0AA40EPI6_9PEZI|nr:hypothetical protein B0T18DRAFT_175737 [Schizothecium vesticola]
METALTFGSLGDIICIWQLAIQLRRALGRGCGAVGSSSKEYQDLRQDLDLFVQILLQVVSTYQQRENSIYLSELDRITKAVVEECASSIDGAVQRFGDKYHDNLQAEGSGSKLRDGYKKLEWAFREKERLQDLREKLQRSTQRLSLLVGLTAQKSNRVDNITLLHRVDKVRRLVAAEAESKDELLQILQEQCTSARKQEQTLNNVEEELTTTLNGVWETLASAKKTLAIAVEIKDLVTSLARLVINSQILASSSTFLRPIDHTRELPVTLEDCLGRLLTIPPEWIERLQWKTLNSLLEDQFIGQNGYEMVCRRQYTLEENCTGKDIERQVPISQVLRRGMKINMSMVFQMDILSGACPRCNTDSQAPKGLTINCKTQGLCSDRRWRNSFSQYNIGRHTPVSPQL